MGQHTLFHQLCRTVYDINRDAKLDVKELDRTFYLNRLPLATVVNTDVFPDKTMLEMFSNQYDFPELKSLPEDFILKTEPDMNDD